MAQHTKFRENAHETGALGLPTTMHGQLYLLANDPKRHRIETSKLWLLGFALRAAVLVDLQVAGHLTDDDGLVSPASPGYVRDPLQQRVFDEVRDGIPRVWAAHIAAGNTEAPRLVRSQLADAGWLHARQRRRFGIVPTAYWSVADGDAVARRVEQVSTAVRHARFGRRVDSGALMLGLLAVLAEIPTVLAAADVASVDELGAVFGNAVPPVAALQDVVSSACAEVRGSTEAGVSCGGCGGCGGGCGGCGGCGG